MEKHDNYFLEIIFKPTTSKEFIDHTFKEKINAIFTKFNIVKYTYRIGHLRNLIYKKKQEYALLPLYITFNIENIKEINELKKKISSLRTLFLESTLIKEKNPNLYIDFLENINLSI